MAIPFKTLKPTEVVEVAGIPIAKRGCLTISEEMAIRDLDVLLRTELNELSAAQQDLELKQRAVTILIQSRLDKEWTLEKTKSPDWEGVDGTITPDMEMLDELFNFFMSEQRRWKTTEEIEAVAEENQGKPGKRSTGQKSTGSSDSSTPTKNGSTPKTLETAPF